MERITDMQEKYANETTIENRTFNLLLGLTVLSGLFVNYLMAAFFSPQIWQLNMIHPIVTILVYFGGSFLGMFIAKIAKNPVVSYIGFLVMAVSMGIILVGYLGFFTDVEIVKAIVDTGIITIFFIVLSIIFPAFFEKLGRVLFIALAAEIVLELISTFFFHYSGNIYDYIVIAIFCLYTGYDWHRAQRCPHTADCAVDSAVDLYLDIINLFIRILSILGGKRSRE